MVRVGGLVFCCISMILIGCFMKFVMMKFIIFVFGLNMVLGCRFCSVRKVFLVKFIS